MTLGTDGTTCISCGDSFNREHLYSGNYCRRCRAVKVREWATK